MITRSKFPFARVLAVGLLVCATVACGKSEKKPNEAAPLELGSGAEPEPVSNSGRTLSGIFLVHRVEDGYHAASSPASQTRYTFDGQGAFKRERLTAGRTVATETGSYLVGTNSELVFYIEKVNGELLGSARVERYVLVDETDASLTLKYGAGRLILEK